MDTIEELRASLTTVRQELDSILERL